MTGIGLKNFNCDATAKSESFDEQCQRDSMVMNFRTLDSGLQRSLSSEELGAQELRRSELAAQLRVGMALRDAREASGVTQTELSRRLGVAQSAVSRIEAGRTNISMGMLRRMSHALGVELTLSVGGHHGALTSGIGVKKPFESLQA